MPMKWTSENDQLLLLLILKTHDLSVDTKRVAEAWPTKDINNHPTPRAISERLVRMRQMAKQNDGSGDASHFTIAKGKGGTPVKSRQASKPNTPSSGKRKKATQINESDADDENAKPIKKEIKEESDDDVFAPGIIAAGVTLDKAGGVGSEESPSKRVRKARCLGPDFVNYDETEGDDEQGVESSSSEYVPEKRGNYDSLVDDDDSTVV